MKFLGLSMLTCFFSFLISAVLFNFAGFEDLKKDFMKGKFNLNSSSFHIDIDGGDDWPEKNFKFSTAELNSIDLKSAASEIKIVEAQGKDLELSVRMNEEELNEHFKADIESGTLKISDHQENLNGISFLDKKSPKGSQIVLKIPKDFNTTYNLDVALSDINLDGISGENFKLKVAAGDIDISNVNFKKFEIKAGAGDLDITNSSFGKAEVEAGAGDIDIILNQESPDIKIKAAAGDIDVSLSEGLEPNLTFENSTTVGSLKLKSGYLKKDDSYVYGEGKGSVVVKTSFGDVEFK